MVAPSPIPPVVSQPRAPTVVECTLCTSVHCTTVVKCTLCIVATQLFSVQMCHHSLGREEERRGREERRVHRRPTEREEELLRIGMAAETGQKNINKSMNNDKNKKTKKVKTGTGTTKKEQELEPSQKEEDYLSVPE